MKSIVIKNLFYRYAQSKDYVLKDINLEVDKGESVVILGPSGAGKSTLLKCINRLVFPKPTRGKILINGVDILRKRKGALNQMRKKMGMIFQNYCLINTMPVVDAVLAGRLAHNSPIKSSLKIFSSRDYSIVKKNLKRVGLERYARTWIGRLSGGEKQRVGIARALSQEPEILLADEPVSNLDPRLMTEIMDLIKNICEEDNLTLVSNLHFIELAKRYADRIVGIKEGEIIFDCSTSELTRNKIVKLYGETKETSFYNEKTKI